MKLLKPPAADGSSHPPNLHRSSLPAPGIFAGDDEVYVAVGKSVEKGATLLHWTFGRFRGRDICMLHVHQPSLFIPTLLGKLPAAQANSHMVCAYREMERDQMKQLLLDYTNLCSQSKVKARFVTTENDQVRKGIMDLINEFGVRKLVMGAEPENWMKVKTSSSKSSYIAENAPSFCQIWFVNQGQLLYTKVPVEGFYSLPPSNHQDAYMSRSQSLHYPRSEVGSDQYRRSSSTSFIAGSTSRMQTPQEYEEENLCRQLEEVKMEVEASRNEAFQELLKRKRFEAQALESYNKVKAYESAHVQEYDLRKIADNTLKISIREQEQVIKQRDITSKDLQKAMRTISILENQLQEAHHRREEAFEELKLIEASMATLKVEKEMVQRQRFEAANWVEDVSCSSRLAKFSSFDLQTATCNFSESFKIDDHGGYGFVYKGEILNRTVVIKKQHPRNVQGESEFQQEVQVLGKLRHKHLVTLLGICPEACALVYEYMPTSLESQLSCKVNSSSMCWKSRTRIISEIANTLLFLHSSKPKKIVHGNLKPENILLDSELSCKLCNLWFPRLVNEENIRCRSFRQYTQPKGAFLFTDPDFCLTGTLTPKSDVYSFGMVILWLLTGKKSTGLTCEVKKAVSDLKLSSILDGEWPSFVARRLADLALKCCELNRRDRPVLTPILVKELEHLSLLEDRQIPSFFMCPILKELMHDPQLAADGFTYEGEALRGWFENGGQTSPMTNLKLTHLDLTPNRSLRLAIQDWLCNP